VDPIVKCNQRPEATAVLTVAVTSAHRTSGRSVTMVSTENGSPGGSGACPTTRTAVASTKTDERVEAVSPSTSTRSPSCVRFAALGEYT
jgi:hypothetical protein